MMVIGTRYYPAEPASERRQARSRASLLLLSAVVPVNLQFADESYSPAGFRTLPILHQDSWTITGAAGARKPIMSEMFDALAGVARAEGCRYFAYLNADIEVTPAALDMALREDRDAYAYSRVNVDPATGAELGIEVFGLDMFVVDAAWWARERRRFRSYVAGEGCWDNVYASMICAHGRGTVVNDRPGIFHQQHPAEWHGSPFAEYNGFLAALDGPYFSRWCHYATTVNDAQKAGTPLDARRLAHEMLGDARLSVGETARQTARQLRARFRYARLRASRAPSSPRQSPRKSG